jgi:hypothetical protein
MNAGCALSCMFLYILHIALLSELISSLAISRFWLLDRHVPLISKYASIAG